MKTKASDDMRIIPDSMKEEVSMLDEIFSNSNLNVCLFQAGGHLCKYTL